MPGGMELKAEVLNTSACSLCGACLDWCPYLKNIEDHLVLRFDCPVKDGKCYSVCPRTMTDWQQYNDRICPDIQPVLEIGCYRQVYKVRSRRPLPGRQDGGTVSELLLAAMEGGMVDGLLLTGYDDPLIPEPLLTNAGVDIARAAGSRFLASPGLRKINEAVSKGWKRLAVIGRPCQMQGLRKLEDRYTEEHQPLDTLAIGLFCMWSLSWSFRDYLADLYPGEAFYRMTIPQHGVELWGSQGVRHIPLDKVREFIRPGCAMCLDMTSEVADISIGSFEPETGWNTVLVRSQKGEALFARAVSEGRLEVGEYPANELERLKEASLHKKARNLAALEQAVTAGRIKPFIDLDLPLYKEIRERAEGMVKS